MTGMVFGVGEILWDLLPSGPQLGGAPANFAFHVAGLGIPADVVSRVGQDARGEAIRTRFSEMRLPGTLLQTDSALPTGTVSNVAVLEGEGHTIDAVAKDRRKEDV